MTVIQMRLNGYAPSNEDIANSLRSLAIEIGTEETSPVRNVVIVIEYEDGDLQRFTCGKNIDIARACGLLTIAANRLANDCE